VGAEVGDEKITHQKIGVGVGRTQDVQDGQAELLLG